MLYANHLLRAPKGSYGNHTMNDIVHCTLRNHMLSVICVKVLSFKPLALRQDPFCFKYKYININQVFNMRICFTMDEFLVYAKFSLYAFISLKKSRKSLVGERRIRSPPNSYPYST